MHLRDWIIESGLNIDSVADALKTPRTTLMRVLTGQPASILLAYKIILLTKGEVTLKDLVCTQLGASGNVQVPEELKSFLDEFHGRGYRNEAIKNSVRKARNFSKTRTALRS